MKRFFIMSKSWASLLFLLLPVMALAAGFDRDLYFGIRNDPDVIRLQEFLRDQGIYSGPVTGNFFSFTREAVKKFQEREKIAPAAGYVGPKTRSRINSLAGSSVEQLTTVEALTAKINELQAKLVALQAAPKEKVASTTADTTPPTFTKLPFVSKSGFISNPTLGAHYPYRVVLDWGIDEKGVLEEKVFCTPTLQIPKFIGRLTEYFPEPGKKYSCTVTVKDQSGNPASSQVSFSTPNWISVSGTATSTFPAIEMTTTKIGEFSVYNGSAAAVFFANFETLIHDGMDSTPNRNRKVTFHLRNGALSTDPLISKADFTFLSTAPKIEEPYRSILNLPFDVTLNPGEEKKVSLWVDQLLYVRAGTLKVQATKVNTVTPGDVTGLFDLSLTREAPL